MIYMRLIGTAKAVIEEEKPLFACYKSDYLGEFW
jgi:hypothetical protein